MRNHSGTRGSARPGNKADEGRPIEAGW